MNLTTPIRIRATFDAVSWGAACPQCGNEQFDRNEGHPDRLNKCWDCGLAFDYPDPATDPTERGGWVHPANPWGSFEQDRSDDSCEPDAVFLPFAEAVEFLSEFPGGIWGYSESESEQSMRTGEWKSVTAHVPDEWEALLFAALDVVG